MSEVRDSLLRRRSPWVFTKISGPPLPPINIFYGDLPVTDIYGNDHDHWKMVHKLVPFVHADSVQLPQ